MSVQDDPEADDGIIEISYTALADQDYYRYAYPPTHWMTTTIYT